MGGSWASRCSQRAAMSSDSAEAAGSGWRGNGPPCAQRGARARMPAGAATTRRRLTFPAVPPESPVLALGDVSTTTGRNPTSPLASTSQFRLDPLAEKPPEDAGGVLGMARQREHDPARLDVALPVLALRPYRRAVRVQLLRRGAADVCAVAGSGDGASPSGRPDLVTMVNALSESSQSAVGAVERSQPPGVRGGMARARCEQRSAAR